MSIDVLREFVGGYASASGKPHVAIVAEKVHDSPCGCNSTTRFRTEHSA